MRVPSHAPPLTGYPVTDAHVHVNRFDLMADGPKAVIRQNPTFPLMERLVADPDLFLAHLDAEGIGRAWLVNYCARDVMGYGWEVNPWVAQYVQADPRRLVAVGGYDPRETPIARHAQGSGAAPSPGAGRPPASPAAAPLAAQPPYEGAAAIDALHAMGIRVLKFHPVHMRLSPAAHRDGTSAGGRLRSAYARMQELGMPLMVHTGTSIFPGADNTQQHVAPIAHVLEDFPDLAVILCHGGRPHETAQAVALLDAHPNAHIDVSSCPPQKLPAYFGDLAARRTRFVWGSDWPGPKVPGMGANVQAFLALGLDDATNEAILHGNAERLVPRR